MDAYSIKYMHESMRRKGLGGLADMMETSRSNEYHEQVQGFLAEHPDAPSQDDYDYALMYERGLMPESSGYAEEDGIVFLPEEGYKDDRYSQWSIGKPLNYDVNSKTKQFPQWFPRVVASGAKAAYQNVATSALGGIPAVVEGFAQAADTGGPMKIPSQRDIEARRGTMVSALTPDTFENMRANYGASTGAAFEQFGSEMTEILMSIGAAKGAGFQTSAVRWGASKTKTFMQGFARRMEDAFAPGVVGGEYLYARGPDNQQTMGAMVATELKEMGFEGEVLDAIEAAPNDPNTAAVANVIEGAFMFEFMRLAGTGAVKLSKGTYNKIAQAVTPMLDDLRNLPAELKYLQTALPFALGANPIKVPAEAAAARLGRQQKRGPEIGAQKNVRTVLQAEGKPDVVVGPQSLEDWKGRVATNLAPEEVTQARGWYSDIRGAFEPWFGDRTDEFMSAWLVANKNASPEQALHNALRVSEQIASGRSGPQGGLNDEALRNLFQGMEIEKGVGQKLLDFVDSAVGKPTRTVMGDDPAGGAPAVVDVHSVRDMGFLDEEYMNFLQKEGYDTSQLELDMRGGPSETQYENAATQMRNLTEELNAEGFAGGDLTPAEVQAIGWTAQSKATGAKAETPAEAIAGNLRRVSYELAPGRESDFAMKYGERFDALPTESKQRVTEETLTAANDFVNEKIGFAVSDLVVGTGAWQKFEPQPALVNQVLASKEGAEVAANMIGYLAQQEQVWVNKVKNTMTKNPKGFAVTMSGDELGDPATLARVWEGIMDADQTGLIQGYQPITVDGKPGIMILVDKGGAKTQQALENEAIPSITSTLNNVLGEDTMIDVRGGEAEITKAGSAGGKYDGESYLARIRELGGEDLIPDLDTHRGQLEERFVKSLEREEGK
jgi:hypothetical protein